MDNNGNDCNFSRDGKQRISPDVNRTDSLMDWELQSSIKRPHHKVCPFLQDLSRSAIQKDE
jgi:hypothetical protein